MENWTRFTWTPDNAYKIIRNLNRTEKDNLRLNPIVERTWLHYYQKLWTEQFNDNTTEGKSAKLTETCFDLIKMEELETTIKTLKTIKISCIRRN